MQNDVCPDEGRLRWHRGAYLKPDESGVAIGLSSSKKRFRIRGDAETLMNYFESFGSGSTAPQSLPSEHKFQGLRFQLRELGFLVQDEPISPVDERYAAQVRFLELFEGDQRSASSIHADLCSKKVVFIGLGGPGTWALASLARMGAHHIIGIDPDRVDRSNLSRQLLYHEADVGRFKVEACKQALARDVPECRFEGVAQWITKADDLIPWLADVDLVVHCFGYRWPNGPWKAITEACHALQIPNLSFGGSWVGPLYIPGQTSCPACFANDPLIKGMNDHSMDFLLGKASSGGTIAPRVATIGGLVAWEAARHLAKIGPVPTYRGVITFDFLEYQSRLIVPVSQNPYCEICSTMERGSTP